MPPSASRGRRCAAAEPASAKACRSGPAGARRRRARRVHPRRRSTARQHVRLTPHVRCTTAADAHAPDLARVGIAVDVAAAGSRHCAAAVDEAAGDEARLERVVLAVRVDEHREDELSLPVQARLLEGNVALVARPAVVGEAAQLVARPVVELLPAELTAVGEIEVAGRPVEREAPWKAQPVADDLPPGRAPVDIDAEQLGLPRRQLLAPVARVTGVAAVADAHPQPAVGPELELAGAVPVVRLADVQQLPQPANGARLVGAVLDHVRVAAVVRVRRVEAVVRRVARVEGEREEPLLRPVAADEPLDVEERLAAKSSADQDAHDPALLGHVKAAGPAPRRADPPGTAHSRGKRLETKRVPVGLRGCERHRDRAGCEHRGGDSHAAHGSATRATVCRPCRCRPRSRRSRLPRPRRTMTGPEP